MKWDFEGCWHARLIFSGKYSWTLGARELFFSMRHVAKTMLEQSFQFMIRVGDQFDMEHDLWIEDACSFQLEDELNSWNQFTATPDKIDD